MTFILIRRLFETAPTPIHRYLIAPGDKDVSVIGAHPEIEVIGAVPSVDDIRHLEPLFTQEKAHWPLMGPASFIARDLEPDSASHNQPLLFIIPNILKNENNVNSFIPNWAGYVSQQLFLTVRGVNCPGQKIFLLT